MENILNIVFYYVGGLLRQSFVLHAVRSLENSATISSVFPHSLHFLSVHFDPNNIRKYSKLYLKPKYLPRQGILGERFILNVNDHIGWNIFVRGYFDLTAPALGIFFNSVLPGGIFLDIGANIGSSSIGPARQGVQTIAIEASSSVVKDLSANVELNLPVPYTIMNFAVTSPDQSLQTLAEFYSPNGNTAASSLLPSWNPSRRSSRLETVRLTTIDAIVRFLQIKKISLMKLDIEGFEYEALQGAQNALNMSPAVLFEWRPDILLKSGREARDLRALFPEGYHFFGAVSIFDGGKRSVEIKLSEFIPKRPYSSVLAIPDLLIKSDRSVEKFISAGHIDLAL